MDPLSEQYAYNSPYAFQENKFGMGIELEGLEKGSFQGLSNWIDNKVDKVLSLTEVDDAAVLVTHFTRDGNAIHVDGSPATGSDKAFALASVVLPVSGKLVKKVVGKVGEVVKKSLKIDIPNAKKIDRDILVPPSKPGNAPTFKKDGSKVEIHHEGQNPKGPFQEMHKTDHRGKGNDAVNHPNKNKPSQIDRKEFNKARRKYWKEQYPKQ